MRPDALAEFRTWLATLAEGEQQRLAAVSEAEDVLAGREREAAAGRQAVAAARKEAAKIEAHRDLWLIREKKESERREDLELEEFAAPPGQGEEGI